MTGDNGENDKSGEEHADENFTLNWDDLPEEFTADMLNDASFSDLQELLDNKGRLNEHQRESLDEAYEEMFSPLRKAIRNLTGQYKFQPIDIGTSKWFPKLDIGTSKWFPKLDTSKMLANMAEISLVDTRPEIVNRELIEAIKSPRSGLSDVAAEPAEVVTPNDLLDIFSTFDIFVTQQREGIQQNAQVIEFLERQDAILRNQRDIKDRFKYFGVFISLVFVAQLVVAMSDKSTPENTQSLLWTVLIGIVVTLLSLLIYGGPRWFKASRKKREKN